MWSHSRLESFETCPRQYWYKYPGKHELDPALLINDGVEALVGTIVHEVAERAYHHVRAKGVQPTLQQGTRYAAREFARRFAAERPHIARRGTDQRDYSELVERCVRNLWLMRAPFNPAPVIGIERRVAGLLGGQQFQGYVDLMELSDGVLTILDYKTSKRAKTPEQIQDDQQLSRYATLLRDGGHKGPIKRIWIFLAAGVTREGEQGTVKPSDVHKRVESTVAQIESRPNEVTAFEPRPSALCRWCKFQKICGAARL